MPQRMLVTGGTGYVGRRLLTRLAADGHDVVALVRARDADLPDGVTPVVGDLDDGVVLGEAATGCSVVVHLAAVTGKARRDEYRRVNVEGTRRLLDAARSASVGRFLFISSVAAAFRRDSRYWYAHSKREAEAVVAAAGIPFRVLRPTIILGPDAPVLEGLRKLAGAPFVPVFGGGRARVQPVHVDDVVRFIRAALEDDTFSGETWAIGGAEMTTMRTMLDDIREQLAGRAPRSVSVPIALVWPFLVVAEAIAFGLTPLTCGQLASFVNDGLADDNPLMERVADRRGVSDMLAELSGA